MISLFRPGNSVLHRVPAWTKLLGLIVVTLALSFWGTSWLVLGAAAVIVVGTVVLCFGARALWTLLWSLRWLLLIMLVPQLIFLPWQMALTNTARVLLVVALASVVTMSTPMSRLLDCIEAALTPLRPLGVRPERVALVLALTISCIPLISGLAGQLREALIARGHRGTSIRMVFPLLVLTLQQADQLADALRARGAD